MKKKLFTVDDKGLTLIQADKDNRFMNNPDANRFDIIPNPAGIHLYFLAF
ncbi:hypothetical protein [Microcoleus vaginatus]